MGSRITSAVGRKEIKLLIKPHVLWCLLVDLWDGDKAEAVVTCCAADPPPN